MERITPVFDALLKQYGPQHWWPAQSALEVVVGALLTQNTAWSNVERSLLSMKKQNLLSMQAILDAPLPVLEQAIRSSGYFRQKAQRLKELLSFMSTRWGWDGVTDFCPHMPEARDELLACRGVGPETADSILCYAFHIPVFVVDAYTKRLCERLRIMPDSACSSYDDIQHLVHSVPVRQPKHLFYNEFHALIVVHAKERCTKRNPRCADCPLRSLCLFSKAVK